MTSTSVQRAGIIGKLPSFAEFFAPPATPAAFARFEALLLDSMEWSLGRAGPPFAEAFARGAMYGFVFSDLAEPSAPLVGALSPSHDSAGRQFPLAFAAPVTLDARALARPELAPFSFEELWTTSIEALGFGLAGDVARMQELAASLDATALPDFEEAAALYGSWSADLPIAELWPLLGLDGDPGLTLRWFLEAVAPLRTGASTSLSLRVPLGALGGVGLCFWLDLLRRSVSWRGRLPSFFWSHDGQSGSALIHLGKPPRQTLAELWLPTGEHDEVADLVRALDPNLAPHLAILPHGLAAILGEGGRVAELLQSLE